MGDKWEDLGYSTPNTTYQTIIYPETIVHDGETLKVDVYLKSDGGIEELFSYNKAGNLVRFKLVKGVLSVKDIIEVSES